MGPGTSDTEPIPGTRDPSPGTRDPGPIGETLHPEPTGGPQDPEPTGGTRNLYMGPGTWDPPPGTLSETFTPLYKLYVMKFYMEEQFRSKKYLLEMTPSRAKLRLKSPPQKRNF